MRRLDTRFCLSPCDSELNGQNIWFKINWVIMSDQAVTVVQRNIAFLTIFNTYPNTYDVIICHT